MYELLLSETFFLHAKAYSLATFSGFTDSPGGTTRDSLPLLHKDQFEYVIVLIYLIHDLGSAYSWLLKLWSLAVTAG